MKKNLICILLSAALLLIFSGCGKEPQPAEVTQPTVQAVIPGPTIPPDGNPGDVTCKGSYTGTGDPQAVAATVGDISLTNEQLQACYWAEVSAYQQAGTLPAPDFSQPLDTQPCEADGSLGSWQQFFLRRALNTWHSAQALILQGQKEGLPAEPEFQPDEEEYALWMDGQPATKYLYRYGNGFQPNTMHQAYLDALPETLEALAAQKGYGTAEEMAQSAFGISLDALTAFAQSYNRGYIYYTNLTYFLELSQEELEYHSSRWAEEHPELAQEQGYYVDFRHILLIPEGGAEAATEAAWRSCQWKAEELLSAWKNDYLHSNEGAFGDLAHKKSQDTGSAAKGGLYRRIRQGQLIPELDAWCFDEARQKGDMGIVRSQAGIHVLYFSGRQAIPQALAEDALIQEKQSAILTLARLRFPMTVDYRAIVLSEAQGGISLSDLLYPDIAHERFPEVPLYLQQDYPGTMYGNYDLGINGCGVSCMAMLSSYMTDEEWTPPEMCRLYGGYSHKNGTDGMLYIYEPMNLGFYLRERTFNLDTAKKALQEGYIVMNVQTKGYWTKGGHYILLEKMNEDGTVQVRDSNLPNYEHIANHRKDRHSWESIIHASQGFWIFEKKVTAIPACVRCGDPDAAAGSPLVQDYTCEKCRSALTRRTVYLAADIQ